MTSIILSNICNDVDDSEYKMFASMPEYLESTLNEEKELYKYLSLGDDPSFVEKVIRDNTIKFGAPSEFNDPFECMSIIGITSFNSTKEKLEELTNNSGIKYSTETLLRAYDEIVNISLDSFKNKSIAKYGILSLSGTWDSILMWAHYSNYHKGIILIFQFYKDDSFYDKMMKVQYKKGITYFDLEHKNCAKKIWESFSTKDPIWLYEKEYRVIHAPSSIDRYDGNGIKPFPRKLLKGIIFGYRIDPKHREDIISKVKKHYPTLKLFDIILDKHEIKLHKVPIDRILI